MIVGEYVGFANMDWALGQTTATTPWTVSATLPSGAVQQQVYPDQASAQAAYTALVQQGATQISMVPGAAAGAAPAAAIPPGYPYPPPAGYPYPPPAGYPYPPAPSTTMVPVPTTGPAGTQVIPIVQLGPMQIVSRTGGAVLRLLATTQVPGRILSQTRILNNTYQAVADQTDYNAGLTVEFSAPGYLTQVVPGPTLLCNRGTRNEYNQVTAMTQNQCPMPNVIYLDPVPQAAPPPQQPSYQEAPQQAPTAAPAPARRVRTQKQAPSTDQSQPVQTTPSPDHVNQVFAAGGAGSVPTWAWAAGGGVLLLGLVYLLTK